MLMEPINTSIYDFGNTPQDEMALMALHYMGDILDIEEAIKEGAIEEAVETLVKIKESMAFLISLNRHIRTEKFCPAVKTQH